MATGSGSAGSASRPGSGGGSGKSAAPDPWAVKDAPPETPASRRKRAEAALGRVASIEPKLAKIRGLAFEHDVPTAYQSAEDFRTFLRREIAKDFPTDKAKDLSAAYAHLGLFRTPIDLAKTLEQTMATQAGAYYDPTAKKFFLVMVPDSDLMLDTMSAHELTHAVTDQHFDLSKYLEPTDRKLDEDASSARRFVGEGDATFTMLVYMILDSIHQTALTPKMLEGLQGQVEMFAGQDLAAFTDMTKKQGAAFGAMDPEIKQSIDAMADLPPAVLVPLFASYTKGALVALTAYQHGGWAAVDDLYRHPPESTEQVLHPATKLYPTRDHPRPVTLAATAEREIANDVMGEMLWWVYFYLWTPKLADEAAQGWGGDRYRVVRNGDGKLVGSIATVWDSETDAKQFAAAYRSSLAARFPGAKPSAEGVVRPDGGEVHVRQLGARVYIVDGGDQAALDALVKTAKL
jgi:hypothetical protein